MRKFVGYLILILLFVSILGGCIIERTTVNDPTLNPDGGNNSTSDGGGNTGGDGNGLGYDDELCGNGRLDPGEDCDLDLPAGVEGSCPTECGDGHGCTTDQLIAPESCAAHCQHSEVTACNSDDGCCPADCNSLSDNDCSVKCGNGVVEPGELCDSAIAPPAAGSCPDKCRDGVACTYDDIVMDSECVVRCAFPAVTTCASGDGCCPGACNATNDADCPPNCGNGIIEPGELCETATGGSCPTSCNDGNACTVDALLNPATCTAQCAASPITGCASGDGCCLAGCNSLNDSDCAPVCGNGLIEAGEICESGSCPTNCDDGNPCTVDNLLNAGSCQARCERVPNLSCWYPGPPEHTGVATLGLEAFPGQDIERLIGIIKASSRRRIEVAMIYGSFRQSFGWLTNVIARVLGEQPNVDVVARIYLDDGPNRRRNRSWWRSDLTSSEFWNRVDAGNAAFFTQWKQEVAGPLNTWLNDLRGFADGYIRAGRLHIVIVPVLEDSAYDVLPSSAQRPAYRALINATKEVLALQPVSYDRNPVVQNCAWSIIPSLRLSNVGLEIHGNGSGNPNNILEHLSTGDTWNNDGSLVYLPGQTSSDFTSTPTCDRTLTATAWKNARTTAFNQNVSAILWLPGFNGLPSSLPPQERVVNPTGSEWNGVEELVGR